MIFALLFILAFLVGLTIYHFNRNWWLAVLVPMVLFVLSVLFDSVDKLDKIFSLVFGVPIILFAALLGTYVYQIQFGENEELEPSNDINPQSEHGDS